MLVARYRHLSSIATPALYDKQPTSTTHIIRGVYTALYYEQGQRGTDPPRRDWHFSNVTRSVGSMASERRYVNVTLLAQVSCSDNSAGRFRRRRRQTQILPSYPVQQTRPTPRWHIRQTTYVSTDENSWLTTHGDWVPGITLTRITQWPGAPSDS